MVRIPHDAIRSAGRLGENGLFWLVWLIIDDAFRAISGRVLFGALDGPVEQKRYFCVTDLFWIDENSSSVVLKQSIYHIDRLDRLNIWAKTVMDRIFSVR